MGNTYLHSINRPANDEQKNRLTRAYDGIVLPDHVFKQNFKTTVHRYFMNHNNKNNYTT